MQGRHLSETVHFLPNSFRFHIAKYWISPPSSILPEIVTGNLTGNRWKHLINSSDFPMIWTFKAFFTECKFHETTPNLEILIWRSYVIVIILLEDLNYHLKRLRNYISERSFLMVKLDKNLMLASSPLNIFNYFTVQSASWFWTNSTLLKYGKI